MNAVVGNGFPIELDDSASQRVALPCVSNSTFISDSHLQQLISNPSSFGMDREIISDFLEAFFLSLWNSEDSTPLMLDVQSTTTTSISNPSAIINIKNIPTSATDDKCADLSPQFEHSVNGNRVLITHETVLEEQRKKILAPYFASQYGIDVDAFTTHISNLARLQYNQHLSSDLQNIPAFNTTISGGYAEVSFNTYFIAIAVVLVGIFCIIGASIGIYSNHKKHREDERKKAEEAKKLRLSKRKSQDIELSPMSGYKSSSISTTPVVAHSVVPLEADKNEIIDMQA